MHSRSHASRVKGFDGNPGSRNERQGRVCDLFELRANSVILQKDENPAGRSALRRGETLGKIHSRKGKPYSTWRRDDVYTPLESLRQHVLLDYRLKLPDRGSRMAFPRETLFVIFVVRFMRNQILNVNFCPRQILSHLCAAFVTSIQLRCTKVNIFTWISNIHVNLFFIF